MKYLVGLLLLVGLAQASFGYNYYVNSYSRSDGTYVTGHFKASPDSYTWNNYKPSTKSWWE